VEKKMTKNIVTAFALSIRSGPGTSNKIVGYLHQNDEVDVLSTNPDGSWKEIRTRTGLVGWCASKYLAAVEGEEPSQPPTPDEPPVEPPGPPPDDGQPATSSYRATGSLKVRLGPGTSYKVTGYLFKGEIVEALALSADKTWLNLRRLNGLVGWSSAAYLEKVSGGIEPPQPEPETPPVTPPEEPPTAASKYYATGSLRIRTGPRTSYDTIAYLAKGEIVEALNFAPDGLWIHVRKHNSVVGWSLANYLAKIEPSTAEPPNASDIGMHRAIVDHLAIRDKAALDSAMLEELMMEDTVDVLEISSDGKWSQVVTAKGLSGWAPKEFLMSLGDNGRQLPNEEFPWMPIAFAEIGMREVPGKPNNPRVLEYLNSTTLKDMYTYLPDETDWCAAFVNWCVEKAKIPSTDSPMVQSWARWGQALGMPRRGCVVIFKWEDGGSHVSFYLGESGPYVYALGGNQSEAVWIKAYLKIFVTGYRIPAGWVI